MSRYRKLHTYPAGELRRSALEKVPAKALCGRTRVVTPFDMEAVKDLDLPLCRHCGNALAALNKEQDVHVRKRTGWVQFEKDTRPKTEYATFTVTITATGNWSDWGPLAS